QSRARGAASLDSPTVAFAALVWAEPGLLQPLRSRPDCQSNQEASCALGRRLQVPRLMPGQETRTFCHRTCSCVRVGPQVLGVGQRPTTDTPDGGRRQLEGSSRASIPCGPPGPGAQT